MHESLAVDETSCGTHRKRGIQARAKLVRPMHNLRRGNLGKRRRRRPLASKRRASVWRPPAERRPRRVLLRVGGIPIPKQDPSSDGLAAQMVLRVSRVCTEPRRASAVPEGWLRLAFRQGEYARRVYANETPNASSRSPHRRQPQSFSSCYTRARSLMCSRGWECSQEDAAIRSWPNRIWHALLRCPVFS